VLQAHSIRAIVANYRMPGMDGVKLLERVQAQDLDTVRILLTGFAERDMASRAIQRGIVFRLFFEPRNIQPEFSSWKFEPSLVAREKNEIRARYFLDEQRATVHGSGNQQLARRSQAYAMRYTDRQRKN